MEYEITRNPHLMLQKTENTPVLSNRGAVVRED